MKLEEIFKTSLLEIFGFNPEVNFSKENENYVGVFSIDDRSYKIIIDLYDLNLPERKLNALDFGFQFIDKLGSTWKLTHFNKDASKIIGATINSVGSFIKNLDVDVIIFGANYENGDVDSRIKLYDKISSKYSALYGFTSIYKIENEKGKYTVVSNKKLTDDEMSYIEENIDFSKRQ